MRFEKVAKGEYKIHGIEGAERATVRDTGSYRRITYGEWTAVAYVKGERVKGSHNTRKAAARDLQRAVALRISNGAIT